MRTMKNKNGFTLVELVMVIVILGILALVAAPKFFDLSTDANTSAEKGVVGGVRSGISTYFAKNKAYPASLDGATNNPCSPTNICFSTVLDQGGITQDWEKTGATTYKGPTTTVYTYTAATGSFL